MELTTMEYYATSLQHILAELERIDLLIQVQIKRSRQIQSSNEAFQGLYISEEELEQLLAKPNRHLVKKNVETRKRCGTKCQIASLQGSQVMHS